MFANVTQLSLHSVAGFPLLLPAFAVFCGIECWRAHHNDRRETGRHAACKPQRRGAVELQPPTCESMRRVGCRPDFCTRTGNVQYEIKTHTYTQQCTTFYWKCSTHSRGEWNISVRTHSHSTLRRNTEMDIKHIFIVIKKITHTHTRTYCRWTLYIHILVYLRNRKDREHLSWIRADGESINW